MEHIQDELTRNARIVSIQYLAIKSNPLFRRSTSIESGIGGINRLEENFNKYGHVAFSNEMLAKSTPGIVSYSSAPQEQVQTPFGWDIEKLVVDIIVESHDSSGVYKSVIHGYTDKYEASYTNRLDPSTRIFVDSVTNSKASIDPMTNVLGQNNIVSAYSVMTDPIHGDQSLTYDINFMQHVAIRPEDIIMGMAANATTINGIETNTLNTITDAATVAKMKDMNPLNNLGEVLTSTAKQQHSTDFHQSDTDRLLDTISHSIEYRVDDQPFFRRLSAVTHMARVGQFTIGEMEEAFGDTSHISVLTKSTMGTFSMDGDSSGVVSVPASKANMFLDASISYLRKLDIVDISFTVTNKTMDGSTESMIISPPASNNSNIDLIWSTNMALDQIKQFAFPLIAEGRYIVSVTVMLTRTDALVTMEFDGMGTESFSFPLLAYSLATPVIGTQQESDAIVNSVSGLTDFILGSTNETTDIIY